MPPELASAQWSVRTKFQTRADEGSQVGLIVGMAAVINQPTEIYPGFVETIAPGAFVESIARDDVRALFNHLDFIVLGRTKAGTLRLAEDQVGLRYEIDADLRSGQVRDVYLAIERKDVTQSSFGFDIVAESWVYPQADEPVQHVIEKVNLWDVSPVTFPAFPQTEVDARTVTRFLTAVAGQVDRDPAELRRMQPAEVRSLFAPTPPPKPWVPPSTPLLTAAYAELRKRQYRV